MTAFSVVIATARGDGIAPVAAFNLIVAFAAIKTVIAALTKDRVVAFAALNSIIARFDWGDNSVVDEIARQCKA